MRISEGKVYFRFFRNDEKKKDRLDLAKITAICVGVISVLAGCVLLTTIYTPFGVKFSWKMILPVVGITLGAIGLLIYYSKKGISKDDTAPSNSDPDAIEKHRTTMRFSSDEEELPHDSASFLVELFEERPPVRNYQEYTNYLHENGIVDLGKNYLADSLMKDELSSLKHPFADTVLLESNYSHPPLGKLVDNIVLCFHTLAVLNSSFSLKFQGFCMPCSTTLYKQEVDSLIKGLDHPVKKESNLDDLSFRKNLENWRTIVAKIKENVGSPLLYLIDCNIPLNHHVMYVSEHEFKLLGVIDQLLDPVIFSLATGFFDANFYEEALKQIDAYQDAEMKNSFYFKLAEKYIELGNTKQAKVIIDKVHGNLKLKQYFFKSHPEIQSVIVN